MFLIFLYVILCYQLLVIQFKCTFYNENPAGDTCNCIIQQNSSIKDSTSIIEEKKIAATAKIE